MALKHGTGPWRCETCGRLLTKTENEDVFCFKCADRANELAIRNGNRIQEIDAAFAIYGIQPVSPKGSDIQLSDPAATLGS